MRRWLNIGFKGMTFIAMVASLFTIFLYAPIEKTMGIIQKIFYIHVASAFLSFFAFFLVFLASLLYLIRKDRRWDILAQSSGEIGIIFCTLVLITGPIWAKPVWNVWWTWDPRLTTTLILWFFYVSYLLLRRMSGEGQKASVAAVFGIIAFINVPLTFFAIRIWRTIHPVVIRSSGIGLSPPMLHTLILTLLALTLLFFYLLRVRMRLERMRDEIGEVRALWEERTIKMMQGG
jgi:heme exporter protein C